MSALIAARRSKRSRLVQEFRVVAQVRSPSASMQLEVDLVVRRRDRDLAVGGLEQAVGRDQRVVVAGAQRLLAGLEVVRGEERQVRDHAVGEARRHFLALAGSLAPDERGADAHRCVRAGDQVGQRRRGARRRLALGAVDAHEAAHRLRDEVERRPVAVRAVVAEAGDVATHDVGLDAPSSARRQPILSMTPGRKLSSTTSAVAISLRSTALPSALRRSSVSDRLLRLNEAK